MQYNHRPPLGIYLTGLMLISMMPFFFSGCQHGTPQSQSQLIKTARANLEQGHFQTALAQLSQVLSEDPDNIQVHENLAWVYLYTGELKKASAEIHYITQYAPNDPRLHYLKGYLYAKLDQWVDALDAYNEALKTSDVDNPNLHYDIANAFMAVNEPDAALKELDVALELEPKNSSFEFGKCQAYRKLKQYEKALNFCQMASDDSNSDEEKGRIETVLQSITLLRLIDEPSGSTTPSADTNATEPAHAEQSATHSFGPDEPQGPPSD